MIRIVGTDNVVERVLSPIYNEAELKELEDIEDTELFELVIAYGGMDCYEEAVQEIFGVQIQDQVDQVMKKIKK